MQKRMKRLILDTLEYVNHIPNSPFANNAIDCAIEDLICYSQYIQDDERETFFPLIERLKTFFQSGYDKESIDMVCSLLSESAKELTCTVYVDFIILRKTHWGAVKPLVEAFEKLGCSVRIIPTPMLNDLQDLWGQALSNLIENDGMIPTDFQKYNIENELPDIIIDNMAVDCSKLPEFRFLRISSIVPNVVHVEHSILTGYTEAMKRAYFRIGRSRCWQYLVPSSVFIKAFRLIMRIDGDYLAKGCPEMDTVFLYKTPITEKEISCLLWNVDALDPEYDFSEDYQRIQRELKYLEEVANHYPSIDMLVRIHPNLKSQEKGRPLIEMIDRIIETHNNVTIDTNPLIYDAYKKADALVTWMSSSTLFSFAATEKPFIVLPSLINGGYDTILDMHLLEVVPIAFTVEDIFQFVETINADRYKEQRLDIFGEYTGPIDGTASIEIAKEVLERYEHYSNCKYI